MMKSSQSSFPAPVLLSSTVDLTAACIRLRHEEFITVDTEFMRERTYWPELCLIQLAGQYEVIVIDALASELT